MRQDRDTGIDMNRQAPLFSAIFFGLALGAATSQADEVKVPVGAQGAQTTAAERPERGTHRDTVVKRFGQPVASTEPVGDPPISRYEYADFFVYFEHDLVIHSVMRHQGQS